MRTTTALTAIACSILLGAPTAAQNLLTNPDFDTVSFDDLVFAPDAGCVDDATTICLNDGRFRVGVAWRTPQGQTGAGHPVRLTDDTGYFWFFNAENVEIVLKVLDACPTAFETFWVFIAGLTNVEAEITVFDTEAEMERTYFNPLDRPFEPVQDTAAFATCP